MAFDPTALGAVPTDAQNQPFDPTQLGAVPSFDPTSLGAIPVDQGRQDYIAKQQKLQQQPFLQKAGAFAEALPGAIGTAATSLGKAAWQGIPTAAQALVPNQAGTNARQNIENAVLLNAGDTADMWNTQAPRFLHMFTGQQETPEQLGQDYDQEQAWQKERGNIQQLGANPAITQQLQQQGGLGRMLADISAPGTATVNPDLQNTIEPGADPTMLIPFGEAGGLIRSGLTHLGMDAAREAAPGLTATLAGKALGGIGAGLQNVSGWKDSLNQALKSGVESLTGNPELAELAGHSGSEALLSKAAEMAGAGPLGEAAGFFAPQALKQAGDAAATAGKVLQEGEGTVPFFERMAQEATAQGNTAAAKVYQLMDSSGAGKLITGAASTAKNAVKATVLSAPYQLPLAGNDPEQAANMVAANLGFGAAGGFLHNFKPLSAEDFQAKQDIDSAAMRAKYGQAWDGATAARVQVNLDKLAQGNPDFNPADPKNQALAAQAARNEMGVLATMIRSNPSANLTFDPTLGNRAFVTDGQGNINVNPNSPAFLPQVMGHELIHHLNNGGQRGAVMNMLLGDPETGKAGVLRSYGPDGSPIDAPEFQQFRANYDKANGGGQANQGKQSVADQKAAEEFYAEALGSVLAGQTKGGELNYARIRRSGATDAMLEKFFGKNAALKLKSLPMGFMTAPDGTPSKFNALDWISAHPELKKVTFDYLKGKDYLGEAADKEHEFKNEFGNQEMSMAEMKANPNEAFARYGNDQGLRFSPPDSQGNRSFLGVVSKKKEEQMAQDQANELFEALKKNPRYFREITTADGKKQIQITGLDDKLLGSLRHLNEFHKDNLIKLNQIVNGTQGTVLKTTYQPALRGGRRYEARERTVRATVPYDLFISQPEGGKGGANILTHLLDVDKAFDNRHAVLALMQKAGLPVDPRFTDDEWYRSTLEKMAQAHFEGRKSTDGTGISDNERDFVNATLGATPQSGGQPIDGVNLLLDTLKNKAGTAKIGSAVKSFRLDRINKLEPIPEYGNIPFQWRGAKANMRPEDADGLKNRIMEPEATRRLGISPAARYVENEDQIKRDPIYYAAHQLLNPIFEMAKNLVPEKISRQQALVRLEEEMRSSDYLNKTLNSALASIPGAKLVEKVEQIETKLWNTMKNKGILGAILEPVLDHALGENDKENQAALEQAKAAATDRFIEEIKFGKNPGEVARTESTEENPNTVKGEDRDYELEPTLNSHLYQHQRNKPESKFLGRTSPEEEEAAEAGKLSAEEQKQLHQDQLDHVARLMEQAKELGQNRFVFSDDKGRMAQIYTGADGSAAVRIPGANPMWEDTHSKFNNIHQAVSHLIDNGFKMSSSTLEKKISKSQSIVKHKQLINAGLSIGQKRFHFTNDDGRMVALIARKDGQYSVSGTGALRRYDSHEGALKFLRDNGFDLMSSGLEKKLIKKGKHPTQSKPEREPMFEGNARPEENPMPEAESTLKTQQDEMLNGKRSAMLFTPGEKPLELPKDFAAINTDAGVFHYNPEKISADEIKTAVKENRIGDILDYGISKKPDVNNLHSIVVRRDKDGKEIESVATDETNLSAVINKQLERKEDGQTISIEAPEKVVGERNSAQGKPIPSQDERAGQAPKLDLASEHDIDRITGVKTSLPASDGIAQRGQGEEGDLRRNNQRGLQSPEGIELERRAGENLKQAGKLDKERQLFGYSDEQLRELSQDDNEEGRAAKAHLESRGAFPRINSDLLGTQASYSNFEPSYRTALELAKSQDMWRGHAQYMTHVLAGLLHVDQSGDWKTTAARVLKAMRLREKSKSARPLKMLGFGSEAAVFHDGASVYKINHMGEEGQGLAITPEIDSKGQVLIKEKRLSPDEMIGRIHDFNNVPGTAPIELQGFNDDGRAITKQRLMGDGQSADYKKGLEREIKESTKAQIDKWLTANKAIQIKSRGHSESGMIPEAVNDQYVIQGRDGHWMLVADLREGNFMQGPDGKTYLTDAIAHRLTKPEAERIPKLRPKLKKA